MSENMLLDEKLYQKKAKNPRIKKRKNPKHPKFKDW